MPPRDPHSLRGLLADLWRELTWTMRLGGLAGALAGLAFALWLTGSLWREARFGSVRVLVFIVLGLTIAGAVLGLAGGSLIELFTPKPPRRRR